MTFMLFTLTAQLYIIYSIFLNLSNYSDVLYKVINTISTSMLMKIDTFEYILSAISSRKILLYQLKATVSFNLTNIKMVKTD